MQNRGWKSIISYLHNLPVIANLDYDVSVYVIITVQKSIINALVCRAHSDVGDKVMLANL